MSTVTAPREVRERSTMKMFWPQEHGAYGQIAFPMVAAFSVAGVSVGGVLFALAVIAGFLAHEPASVVLGLRGVRAKRDHSRQAMPWLVGCLGAVAVFGCAAVLNMDSTIRWSVTVPFASAILLAIATIRGEERSGYGETVAALAFSTAAVPIVLAGGSSFGTAAAVVIPLALLFVASTLAVRVVILRVRGGGKPAAMRTTRRTALCLAAGGGVALAIMAATHVLSIAVLASAVPGLLTTATIALHPPAPKHLRTLGWTLVGVSVATVVLIVATA